MWKINLKNENKKEKVIDWGLGITVTVKKKK